MVEAFIGLAGIVVGLLGGFIVRLYFEKRSESRAKSERKIETKGEAVAQVEAMMTHIEGMVGAALDMASGDRFAPSGDELRKFYQDFHTTLLSGSAAVNHVAGGEGASFLWRTMFIDVCYCGIKALAHVIQDGRKLDEAQKLKATSELSFASRKARMELRRLADL